MTEIPLFSLTAADIFVRAVGVGELLLIVVLLFRWPLHRTQIVQLCLVISIAAYLLLTAPVPDADYGILRNVLLVLTDSFVYLAWYLAMTSFDDEFEQERWPTWLKVVLVGYGLLFVYFLGVTGGIGFFHDAIHGIALVLMVHIIYVAVQGFNNDLIDSRRRIRILIVVVAVGYSMFLVVLEFMNENIRNDAVFSLVNSAVLCLSVLVVARRLLQSKPGVIVKGGRESAVESELLSDQDVPEEFAELKRRLDDFIDSRLYQQSELSISAMARQLKCPDHHLRRLINRVLGFRNFNAFLNDLRVQDAAIRLRDPELSSKPILTIALELGYGSIGPFNRAFKAAFGQTPSDFRQAVQNRR